VKQLSNRPSIHGIVLLSLFVYKYVADTTFILISCRNIPHKGETVSLYNHFAKRFDLFLQTFQVFQYDADEKCFEAPMIVFFVLAILALLIFVIPTPILILIASKKQYQIWLLKVHSQILLALYIYVSLLKIRVENQLIPFCTQLRN